MSPTNWLAGTLSGTPLGVEALGLIIKLIPPRITLGPARPPAWGQPVARRSTPHRILNVIGLHHLTSEVHMLRNALRTFLILHAFFLAARSEQGNAQEPVQKHPSEFAYQLHYVRFPTFVQAFRFKPGTGETWRLAVNKWEKVEETAVVPKGHYQFHSAVSESGKLHYVNRLDPTTGMTWVMHHLKWEPVEESR